ncbi:MAG: hypothetical protein CVV64_00385 [Candidatus Wallbacteria bacterium HGW-Wallbacteria-1]|jgi:ligand-binding sensor domain-containing protein|uniref:Two component regulator propeller n=1 Tax=Candidatus Wallbacteria bacterium HGW-Wallbacteria-1 TaxID=2013854 RepID=A0A2N1PUB3_9BACT|nr:MAG: hypothetical protein CVV64_00385 [Candidatus Wallbacteria bacterium HGW-Wallbacteria-1]
MNRSIFKILIIALSLSALFINIPGPSSALAVSSSSPEWITYGAQQGLPSDFVTAVALDSAGKLWAGTWEGVASLDGEKGGTWNSYSEKDGLKGSRVTCLESSSGGGMWVGTLALSSRGGVTLLNNGSCRIIGEETGFRSDAVTALSEGPDGNLWIGTWGDGLALFNVKEWKLTRLFTLADGLPSQDIVSVIATADGVWVGTKYNGAAFWDGYSWKVYNEHSSGLRNNAVHSICIRDGECWFGTWAGAFRISGKADFSDPTQWSEYTDFMGRLADRFVRVLKADRWGGVWFGTDKGLTLFNGEKWTTFTTTSIRETVKDESRGIWIPSVRPQRSLPSNTVLDITFDGHSMIWVATDRGVAGWDISKTLYSGISSGALNSAAPAKNGE